MRRYVLRLTCSDTANNTLCVNLHKQAQQKVGSQRTQKNYSE